MMVLCPGTLEQECRRPLKVGEKLCPSCQSEKDREDRWMPLSPFVWVVRRLIKKKWMKKKDNI